MKIRLQIAIEARVLSLSNKIIKKLFETQKKIEKVPHLKISTFDFDMPHMTHRRDFLKFKYVHCSQPHFDCFSSFSIAINFLFYRATIRSYLFFFSFQTLPGLLDLLSGRFDVDFLIFLINFVRFLIRKSE